MPTIRPLMPNDVPAVTDYALRVLRGILDIPVHISEAKVSGCVQQFANNFIGHWNMSAWRGRRLVGLIAVTAQEMPFFDRMEVHVCFCHAEEPGVGMRLVRRLMEWVANDMRIRRVVWMMNGDQDRLQAVLARRYKFKRRVEGRVFYKGG